MNLKTKTLQRLTTAQNVAGMIMICSLLGCSLSSRSSQTIIVSRDSEIPLTEHWVVKSVISGDRLILKKIFQRRTLQLCGLSDLTSNAKSYVEKKVKQPPETMPITFAGKDEKGIWYGDMWVNTENNNDEESITGLLLLNGLAKLSKDYYNCPNGDSFKLAENLAKEKKSGIWSSK